MPRLFVAVSPPDEVRRRVAALADAVRRAAGPAGHDLKWVPAENLHVTLQFLGAVAQDRLPPLVGALSEVARATAPLALEVRGAGAFPDARRPRVLWLGLGGDTAPLAALAAAVGRRLTPLGFPPEARPFSAHLTLARARNPRGAPRVAPALAAVGEVDPVPWAATELVLMQSHLSPKGPSYDAVARLPFGTGAEE